MPERIHPVKIRKTLAVVLSGGASKRFGGNDKGLQLYQGKPLICGILDRINPQVEQTIISANRNIEQYQKLGFTTVEDVHPSFAGPIAGILAGANTLTDADRLLVVPCDTPNVPLNYAEKLSCQLEQSDASVAVVNDGVRRQNLHCLIDMAVLGDLSAFYQRGGRAMHRWFQQISIVEVDFSDQTESFLNINSPEQLK